MPSLSVRCPRCQTVLKVDAAEAGQATTCNHCGQGMLVPSSGAPPVVNAPPVTSPAPASAVETPLIQITSAPPKGRVVAPVIPPRELAPQEKSTRRIRGNIVMLVFGVLMLTITVLVLLRLTEGANAPP